MDSLRVNERQLTEGKYRFFSIQFYFDVKVESTFSKNPKYHLLPPPSLPRNPKRNHFFHNFRDHTLLRNIFKTTIHQQDRCLDEFHRKTCQSYTNFAWFFPPFIHSFCMKFCISDMSLSNFLLLALCSKFSSQIERLTSLISDSR